jgi:double-stranded uracil-DNA glycosylase
MLQGLAPIVAPDTRLVVLGSFPGARSLATQQYYGHPRNDFWKILSALWAMDLPALDYAGRCATLRAHRVGVWDVYASCEREGSLDTAIRNATVNDFAALAAACPDLRAVAHNGGESYRHAGAVAASFLAAGMAAPPIHRLPSTSPANASWSFARKLAAWREVFAGYGVA